MSLSNVVAVQADDDDDDVRPTMRDTKSRTNRH